MGLIEDVKYFYYKRSLERNIRSRQGRFVRKPTNLVTAKTIGILFDANTENNQKIILQFAKKLEQQKKKITLLGFVQVLTEDEVFPFPTFTKKEIDWAFRPKGETVEAFLKQHFDLFLHLNSHSESYSDYIAALSNASFKVGPYTKNTHCYDLMIDANGQSNLKTFIQQTEGLLAKINTTHEAA